MSRLTLRPVRVSDEPAVRRAHDLLARDDFDFALFHESDASFQDYVERHQRWARGIDLPDGWVPAHFLMADVGGEAVGRVSIRHELNDFLASEGGHIGYGVVPEHRRRGYATEILRQSLVVARSVGVRDALLFCDDDNVGSAAVIEACGGVLESRPTSASGGVIRGYVIPMPV